MQAQFNVEHSVFFDTDKYTLSETETTRLQQFLAEVEKEGVIQIEIFGYCDDRGTSNYNLTLSQNRANQIKKVFKYNSFFPEKITTVDGKGELLLTIIDEEDSSIIRALNRRVDIVISYPDRQNKTKKEVSVENNEEKAFSLENVLFITGYSYLTRKSKKVLNDVAEIIKKETFSFVIQGHVCCTDGTVDAIDKKTNQRNLSVARAKYVYDFFVKKGINKTRMSYEGLAHKFPLGGSEDKDRRVEIKVLEN